MRRAGPYIIGDNDAVLMTLADAQADAAYPLDAPHVCPACWNTPLTGCDEHRGAAAEDHAEERAERMGREGW